MKICASVIYGISEIDSYPSHFLGGASIHLNSCHKHPRELRGTADGSDGMKALNLYVQLLMFDGENRAEEGETFLSCLIICIFV